MKKFILKNLHIILPLLVGLLGVIGGLIVTFGSLSVASQYPEYSFAFVVVMLCVFVIIMYFKRRK